MAEPIKGNKDKTNQNNWKEGQENRGQTGWDKLKERAPVVLGDIKGRAKVAEESRREKMAKRAEEKAKKAAEQKERQRAQEEAKKSADEQKEKKRAEQKLMREKNAEEKARKNSDKQREKKREEQKLIREKKTEEKARKNSDEQREKKREEQKLMREKKAEEKANMAREKKKFKVRYIVLAAILCCLVVGGNILWKNFLEPIREMYETAVAKVEVSNEDTFRAAQTSLVYDKDGELLVTLKGDKDSYYLKYDEIPAPAKLAMISIEDKKFPYHRGVDVRAVARAGVVFIKNGGKATQGGSTITQQLSRNVFLSFEKTWKRKVEELFVSIELEKKYSKEEILEFYLNNINFSNGYYGIQAASKGYFRKDAEDLSLSQIVFLCAIPNNPTLYNPLKQKENTLARRDRILQNMLDDGYISQEQFNEAVNEKIKVYEKKKTKTTNDYVETYVYHCATEMLMQQEYNFEFQYAFDTTEEREGYMEEYTKAYNECHERLYTGGYQIYTTIDFDIQKALQDSVNDKLSGFKKKDENNTYKVQGAATCIDNNTGYVVAIVGGRKKAQGEYHTLNRAYQSFRQPGSAIKPLLVYAPYLEQTGKTPDTMVDDSPLAGDGPSNSGGYLYDITLREAVEISSNVATYRLYKKLTPEKALSYLENLGFSKLSRNDYKYLTTCLGGFYYGTNTVEMAAGYATLENDGEYRRPTCVSKIITKEGKVLERTDDDVRQVYKKNAARMMTDVLQSVVTSGTAKNCALPNMEVAAKTGTTNDETDGWLCGYTPYYTTAVWVGANEVEKIEGLKGNTYPAYIWKDFMQEIHKNLPNKSFKSYTQKEKSDSEEKA